MAARYKNYHVRLTCNHVLTCRYINPGTEVYCRRCMKLQQVIECNTKWYWKCVECRATRFYLAKKLKGEREAMRHHREHPNHHVTYYDPDGRTWWLSHPTDAIQLEINLSDPRS